ncbi:cupin domain-containing protein [Flavihumibacter sp. ZG627]|uniref:cupin domain-containing protein n=1 Tax=Flavihumibacter sp. ZG627 TaxID=1463156 RepID=UPI00057EEEB0|nr:cupin domain-containing protein [Flavihumibacter sp. ZG627]KIC91649.1 cupin [Flavihumibacter sp. ZG627]
MNRNTFLNACLSAGAFLAAPFTLLAEIKKKRVDKGIRVLAGKDRFDKPQSLMEGDVFYTKVSSKDTNGDIYIFESTRDRMGGPPLHYHYEQDEWWYILEGEFLFKVGEETFTAKAGDSIFGPRMVPHAFAKTNEGIGRLLMAFQPAGKMEEHFKALSEGIYSKLSAEEKHKFRQNNGFEVVGPALTIDKSLPQK